MHKSIIDKLLTEYESFTAAEKKIADYVLTHQRESQGMSITELSTECSVAVSTVSVFCRKLKLAGFNDFKLELARSNTISSGQSYLAEGVELQPGDTADQVMTKIYHQDQETLRRSANMLDARAVDRAVDLFTRAGRVLLLGQGNHAAVAMTAWAQFAVTSSKFQTIQDSHLQAVAMAALSPGDVVVYFSYTGATLEIIDAAETIHQVGAKLVLITRFARSPAAESADVVLVFGADEKPLQFGSGEALLSQLYVVDVLLNCYYLRNRDQVERNRERIGKALSKKHL